jgi:hypothetical protein
MTCLLGNDSIFETSPEQLKALFNDRIFYYCNRKRESGRGHFLALTLLSQRPRPLLVVALL